MARVPFQGSKRGSPGWCARSVLRFLVSTLAATVGASVLTTPLTALYFNSVPLISLLSNLLTLWAVSGLFGAGLILGGAGVLLPQAAALLARLGARGVDRVVPMGRALDFDTIWDGRDLIACLSRVIG